MKLSSEITEAVDLWMDSVARTLLAYIERFTHRRPLQLIEQDDGTFQLEGQSNSAPVASRSVTLMDDGDATWEPGFTALIKAKPIELVLLHKRFLHRPLEFPRRAGEFLDGIVRSQIDRLTPWRAQDALFGYSQPAEIGNDRISVTIVATARTQVQPFIQKLTGLGARSVCISTNLATSDTEAGKIRMIEQAQQNTVDPLRLRHALKTAILIVIAISTLTYTATSILVSNLQAEQNEITQEINKQRAAMRSGHDADKGLQGTQRALEKLKRETPSSVLLLEALSTTLPDDTYVTELRIAGKKLQIIGMTRNAPALIGLMEHSPHFKQASFFAPTTQASRESRENFHIEAQINPVFTVTP